MLRVLGRRVGSTATLVIATYRDDELERDHPLRVVLGDLATADGVRRLKVEPLSAAAVARMTEGREVDPVALYRLTVRQPVLRDRGARRGRRRTSRQPCAMPCSRGSRGSARTPPRSSRPFRSLLPRSMRRSILAVVGEASESIDECLASGVLRADGGGVAFRHELARVAVEESISPARRLALHRSLLLALMDSPRARADVARIAHHAEQAADREAVLRFAPAAATEAARAGAYREAAAQYARALRFGGDLGPGDRAELLEGRSRACYLADDQTEAIEVIREAIRCRQEQGARLEEARALTELTDYLWCRGYNGEAEEALTRAAELAADGPERREHAYVLHTQALDAMGSDLDMCLERARRAQEIGERFGDETIAAHARVTVASATAQRDPEQGIDILDEAVESARRMGEHEVAARGLNALVYRSLSRNRHDLVERYVEDAIEYCTEHTQDLWRIHVQAVAARWALDRGRWDDAVGYAGAVIDDPRESPWTHHESLCVLALVRARRGDPGARDALSDAAAVGVPREEEFAHVDLAAARSEVAWLEGATDDVDAATAGMLSTELGDPDSVARLRFWRRLAGLDGAAPVDDAGPYALGLAGRWEEAANEWDESSRPYEAALARSRTEERGGAQAGARRVPSPGGTTARDSRGAKAA